MKMHEITIEDLHGIQWICYHTIVQSFSLAPREPIFVGTLLLWEPCLFRACLLWKDGKDLLPYNALAALWKDGKELLWPSGGGPLAPSLVVVLMPQDGKD
jgi:hypothetical protein